MVLLAGTALSLPAQAEFNPSEGSDRAVAAAPKLPATDMLTDKPRAAGAAALSAISPAAGAAPVTFSPMTEAGNGTSDASSIPPLQPVASIGFPHVDAQTLQAGGFIAPAPLIAAPVPVPAPSKPAVVSSAPAPVLPKPMAVPASAPVPVTIVAAQPVPQESTKPAMAAPAMLAPAAVPQPLSRDTKTIISHIPSKLDTDRPAKGTNVSVARVTPDLHDLQVKGKVDAYEANGIKISVRRSGLDTNFELNRAYNALTAGDSQAAVDIYKNILSYEPANADALFGLASIYHRQGQLEKARTYYATLLKNYPNHRDGLNNFLVLVSDESPQEALAELVRLEQRNPDFSPIPAQEAMLLHKQGFVLEAHNKMIRAIELSPENLTYKYNLAVMLDTEGNYPEASELYRRLIEASQRGETLPAPVDTVQKRLNFITTTMVAARPAD